MMTAKKSSLFRLELNEQQEDIIRQMAQIQITHLLELYQNPHDEHSEQLREVYRLAGKDVTDLHYELADMMNEFDKVIEDPAYVGQMDNTNISLVKHILVNFFDEHHQAGDPDYKGIFRQIFMNEDREQINLN